MDWLNLNLLILGILLLTSCKFETEPIPHQIECKDLVISKTADLDLNCYEGQTLFNNKGYIGDDEFCHFDGVEDFKSKSVIGSRFITNHPFIDLGNENLSGTQHYFALSLSQDFDHYSPEGYVKFYFGLPGNENIEEDLFKILKIGDLHFLGENNSPNGFSVDFVIPVIPQHINDSYSFLRFSSSLGVQNNSYCRIKSFNSIKLENHFEGEIEIEYMADLYHDPSHRCEGYWQTIEGIALLPWQFYP